MSNSSETNGDRKRKAIPTESLFLVKEDDSPEDLAKVLLAGLPPESTTNSNEATKLLSAFELVKSKLQYRANLMSAASIKIGKRKDILISNVSFPHVILQHVLGFLPRCEVVRTVSLVAKPWHAVVQSSEFWPILDSSTGLIRASTTIRNSSDLVTLLKKPIFTTIKRLAFPYKIQCRKGLFRQLSKLCPLLEELDVGCDAMTHTKVDNHALSELAILFPHLKSLAVSLYRADDDGVAAFVRSMGERLISLGIFVSYNCRRELTNRTLKLIADSCPNLQRFYYRAWCVDQSATDTISGESILHLLKGCSLKHLGISQVASGCFQDISAFEYICQHPGSLETLELVNHHQTLQKFPQLSSQLEGALVYFSTVASNKIHPDPWYRRTFLYRTSRRSFKAATYGVW